MTPDYLHDFIRLYYLKCGEYDTKIQAYNACEEVYRNFYRREIAAGLMKPTRFVDFNSFIQTLTRFMKDPKNRKRIEI